MSLSDVPDDIVLHELLPFLCDAEDLYNLSLTCKRLHRLTNDDRLWEKFVPDCAVRVAVSSSTMCPTKEMALRELYGARCLGWRNNLAIWKMRGSAEVTSSCPDKRVAFNLRCKAFALGGEDSLALDTDGTLYRGDANRIRYRIMKHNPFIHSIAVDGSGGMYRWWSGIDTMEPLEPLLREVVAVSCGDRHSAYLCRDGRIFGIGENGDMALGFDTRKIGNIQNPRELPFPSSLGYISCGPKSTFGVVVDKKTVIACGANYHGCLSEDDNTGRKPRSPGKTLFSLEYDSDLHVVEISATNEYTLVLYSNGKCRRSDIRGAHSAPWIDIHDTVGPIVKISNGGFQSAFLSVDGECWIYQLTNGLVKISPIDSVPIVDIACLADRTAMINARNHVIMDYAIKDPHIPRPQQLTYASIDTPSKERTNRFKHHWESLEHRFK